ncbi:MAG: MT-A70 family methyltransferase [Cuniculiplasma sp.]
MAGIEPKYVEFSGDSVINFVITKNLKRRHLNASQKAILSLDLLPLIQEEARKRKIYRLKNSSFVDVAILPPRGKSRDQVAGMINVNPHYIQDAKKIVQKAPELRDQIAKGNLSIPDAKKILKFDDNKRSALVFEHISNPGKSFPQIVGKMQKEEAKQQGEILKQKTQELKPPDRKYSVIVIDPPWDLGTTWDPNWMRSTPTYPVMDLEEIKKIKLPMEKDCIVWIWIINRMIPKAGEILNAWGLEFREMLTWDKEKFGIGRWLRGQTEHCILATNGNPKMDSAATPNILRAPSTGHSEKPDAFYKLVDKICFGPKLDFFARKKRDGWDAFGTMENETLAVI